MNTVQWLLDQPIEFIPLTEYSLEAIFNYVLGR
jgi:hypothetical protein